MAAGEGKLTVQSAAVNLTKNLVGAGIFSLPMALRRGSVLPGVSVMAIVGALCASSFVLIAYMCRALGCKTYREVWCAGFGRNAGWVPDVCILLNGFFACVSYVILIVDFLQKALEGLFGWEVSRSALVWANTILFLLPLSHARNLSALRYTSIMGLVIIGLVFAYIVLDFLGGLGTNMENLRGDLFRVDMGLFSTVAISTGAFKAHYNAPKFFKELGEDLKAHSQMVMISYGAAFAIYASFALAGLGLFGDKVLGNLLKNYSAEGNVPILMAWLGMAFAIVFTYPLVFSSARDSIIGMSSALKTAAESQPVATHVGITSSMVFAISTLACFLEDVSVVTGLLGATIGSCLCWIFPALIYLRVSGGSGKELNAPLLPGGTKNRKLKGDSALKCYSVILVLGGTASMVIGICSVFGLL